MKSNRLFLCRAAAVMTVAILGLSPTLPARAAASDGWQLVWSDEFDQPGLPDPAKWNYETGFVRNNELQLYTKARLENARVEGGSLVIEARREKLPNPGFKPDAKPGSTRAREFSEYTSASLTTKGITNWCYGRVEVRAKIPRGRGMWPAIWMLGVNPGAGWPACGEIDIMEYVGFEPDNIHGTVHTAKYNHIKKTQKGTKVQVKAPYEDFHVYGLEWDAEKVEFLVDGKKYFSFANEHTGTEAWPFDHPHYLILNSAVGGAWGAAKGVDTSIFPQKFLIDYVRVYQKKAAAL